MALVFGLMLAQGIFQVLGVSSIFPFLALAADPTQFRSNTYVAWLLDALPQLTDDQLLVWIGGISIATLFISNAINLASEYVRARYIYSLGHWLRVRLLDQYAAQDYEYFVQVNSGVILKKITSDVLQFTQSVLAPVLEVLSRLLTIVLMTLLLLFIDPLVALAGGCGLGGAYGIVFWQSARRRHRITVGLGEANRGTVVRTQEFLGGIKSIFTDGCSDYFIDRVGAQSKKQAQLYSWIPVITNSPRYIAEPLAFGGLVAVVAWSTAQGHSLIEILPVVGVAAAAGYRLLPAVQLLYGQLTHISSMRHALDELFDEFRHVRDTPPPDVSVTRHEPLVWQRELRFDRVSFHYRQNPDRQILSDVSFTIPKGSRVAFVGPTGSGKSTLCDLLLGLFVPTNGQIAVDELPLDPTKLAAWRAMLGYVPQEVFLIDGTLTENIAFGVPVSQIDHDRVRYAATLAQATGFIDGQMPRQFDTVIGERGVRLSGGQRQRLGIARALYRQPQFLVLDEATSALDNTTEGELLRAIAKLPATITTITIAHRLSTVAECDCIYFLDNGRIVASGDYETLRRNCVPFRELSLAAS